MVREPGPATPISPFQHPVRRPEPSASGALAIIQDDVTQPVPGREIEGLAHGLGKRGLARCRDAGFRHAPLLGWIHFTFTENALLMRSVGRQTMPGERKLLAGSGTDEDGLGIEQDT